MRSAVYDDNRSPPVDHLQEAGERAQRRCGRKIPGAKLPVKPARVPKMLMVTRPSSWGGLKQSSFRGTGLRYSPKQKSHGGPLTGGARLSLSTRPPRPPYLNNTQAVNPRAHGGSSSYCFKPQCTPKKVARAEVMPSPVGEQGSLRHPCRPKMTPQCHFAEPVCCFSMKCNPKWGRLPCHRRFSFHVSNVCCC
jgi:hypothetical protein